MATTGRKNFKDIPISTRTIIVSTNLQLNIENLYSNLPITAYKTIEKKRSEEKECDF